VKNFTDLNRNFDNIQFEELRKIVDAKFNAVHDELSDCYYNKKSFRECGVLDKETFDKLHGLIFLMRDVEFHNENLKQATDKLIPEEKYNLVIDKDGNVISKKNEDAASKIAELKSEGIELTIE